MYIQKQNLQWEGELCIPIRTPINADLGFFLCLSTQPSEDILVVYCKTYAEINIFTLLSEYMCDMNHAPRKEIERAGSDTFTIRHEANRGVHSLG